MVHCLKFVSFLDGFVTLFTFGNVSQSLFAVVKGGCEDVEGLWEHFQGRRPSQVSSFVHG
ncbi:unnamed protein product [Amoebophrya sp. A25]|nr:unnamed protein product [Amoebophrya sp. A25]|eukprot:GSA25T00015098001.1